MGAMATTNEAIGARVKTLLDGHAMSQVELAKRIGIDPGALSRAIRGERTFKPREIARISEELDVSTALLLEGRPSESRAGFAARRSVPNTDSVTGALERAK